MIATCAEAGVPVIRTMITVGPEGYLATEASVQRALGRLVPLLDKYGVTLGVQNHCGQFVNHAMGLRHLMERFEPRHIAAIWDAAHNALQGEPSESALDIIWTYLCMVNLKNAFWQRTTGPEATQALWRPYWTSGRHGLASWPAVAAELKRRGYGGVICLTAEYSDESAVDRLIAEDLAYTRSLFA